MQTHGVSDSFKNGVMIFILLLLGIPGIFLFVVAFGFGMSDDRYTITTVLGDSFTVDYDSFKADSRIVFRTDDGIKTITVGGKVERDDFVPMEHTDSLTVYKLNDRVIFDDGDGFDIFDKETDKSKHSDVAQVVKDNLHSDNAFYKRNKDLV